MCGVLILWYAMSRRGKRANGGGDDGGVCGDGRGCSNEKSREKKEDQYESKIKLDTPKILSIRSASGWTAQYMEGEKRSNERNAFDELQRFFSVLLLSLNKSTNGAE